jgi:5S rRNA maturation endonuclease (ribonuclease M5)
MVRPKKRVAEVKSSSDDVYGKVEELPEDRRRAYVTILEDFDKQGIVILNKFDQCYSIYVYFST